MLTNILEGNLPSCKSHSQTGSKEHFADLEDPRIDRAKDHQLLTIIIIAICAVICGADGWTSVEKFGNAKLKWFIKFWDLLNGIPSHDTFGRVFARITPEAFQGCFSRWIHSVAEITAGQVLALDGQQLRHSFDTWHSKAAIHMVSAWATANHLVLGQRKVAAKSNELHWVLDSAFRADDCRIRQGFAAENMAVLRHIALSLLKQDTSQHLSIKNKRLLAGWDESYLQKILAI